MGKYLLSEISSKVMQVVVLPNAVAVRREDKGIFWCQMCDFSLFSLPVWHWHSFGGLRDSRNCTWDIANDDDDGFCVWVIAFNFERFSIASTTV